MSEVLPAGDPGAPARAVEVLGAGGLVVLPTDTVYGLAARVDRPDAVARIFEVKRRPRKKPLPVLVADEAAARRLARFNHEAERMAREGWPGPLTLVLEAAAPAPDLGGDGRTIGLRVPAHPVALEILRLAGPLAATSANPSGEPVPESVAAIAAALGEGVDLYLDGGRLAGAPSRVVSLVRGVRVLRE